MSGVFACRAALIMAGLALGAGMRARTMCELERPVLFLGLAGVVGSIGAAVVEGGWGLPLVATLSVLGFVLTVGASDTDPRPASAESLITLPRDANP